MSVTANAKLLATIYKRLYKKLLSNTQRMELDFSEKISQLVSKNSELEFNNVELELENDRLKSELERLKMINAELEFELSLLKFRNLDLNEESQKEHCKGSKCSVSGSEYERQVHSVVNNSFIDGERFNTQDVSELAGSSSKNDLECIYRGVNFGVEVKRYNTPDWMQFSIKYDSNAGRWKTSSRGKNPKECRDIMDALINELHLYGGELPPFIGCQITHDEWIGIKRETDKWDDKYIDIPSSTIADLYRAKGCSYIQISDDYGLYHLGDDICSFDVPYFEVEQQLRIRTKIHKRKNSSGHCSLSITVACQPKDIKKIAKSQYSLDDKNKLPPKLEYKE